jgi:hypothetical protein
MEVGTCGALQKDHIIILREGGSLVHSGLYYGLLWMMGKLLRVENYEKGKSRHRHTNRHSESRKVPPEKRSQVIGTFLVFLVM